MPVAGHFFHDVQRLRQLHAALVGPVCSGQRLKNIGNAHHAGLHRHLLTRQPARVAFAIHALVVPPGIFGHVFQVPRPRQCLQHLDGGDDVVIDGVALGLCEGAGTNGEVFHFLGCEKGGLHALHIAPLALHADGTHAQLVGGLHGLHAFVAAPQKITIGLDTLQLALQVRLGHRFGPRIHHRTQGQLCAQRCQLGIAFEHFKARVHQVDAVINGLQLGRLVHHMHRRRDLAAVVQQARHLQLVAVALGHVKVCQRPFGRGIGGFGQHHRQGGHTLAMPTGVGRFFVNGDVDELDERLEQAFKLRNEQPIGQRNGRLRGQRFGQALVGLRESHHLPRFRVQCVE